MRLLIPVLLATSTTVLAQAPLVGPHGEPVKKVAVYTPSRITLIRFGGNTSAVQACSWRMSTPTQASCHPSAYEKALECPRWTRFARTPLIRWRFIPHVVEPKVVIPIRF